MCFHLFYSVGKIIHCWKHPLHLPPATTAVLQQLDLHVDYYIQEEVWMMEGRM